MKKLILGILLAILIQTVSPLPAFAETLVGGMVPDGYHFKASDSPYRFSDTVLIDEKSTVTIDAGASLVAPSGKPLFWNLGRLIVHGTSDLAVSIQGNGNGFCKIANAPKTASIEVAHALFSNVGNLILSPTNEVSISVEDSELSATPIDVWYPSSLVIERNVFINGGGIKFGFDRRGKSQGVSIKNNLFLGDGTMYPFVTQAKSTLWITAWATYGEPAYIAGNSFQGL
ncbi:MAG: hypothetical protein RJA26_722, partial [Actinomycetota bacterium]